MNKTNIIMVWVVIGSYAAFSLMMLWKAVKLMRHSTGKPKPKAKRPVERVDTPFWKGR